MRIFSAYDVRIADRELNHVFSETTRIYRSAVDFFIHVRLEESGAFSGLRGQLQMVNKMEHLTNRTKKNPSPKYDFGKEFYKFPCYYRRAAIAEAIGKVASYENNLKNWEQNRNGKKPGLPKAGYTYPSLYKGNAFKRTEPYYAEIKVWIRNTWDWVRVPLRKTDADYINRYCSNREECVPTLVKDHKIWGLRFSFKEDVSLVDIPVMEQSILAVDLGINSACACTAMKADGTVVGRKFLKLPTEEDSLRHALNKIRKAHQNGNRKTPRLWAKAKGINERISALTAQFIIDTAVLFGAFTIVFEHLDTQGKKKGKTMRQRLHHWRANDVQNIVAGKAHRLHMHISRINAWGTSRYAFDGSGKVLRGSEAELETWSLCKFQNGKIYNCDLNASYNIGARYYIREILKSLPARERLRIEAKVPQCSKRSTCTLSTLISLNAEFSA